MDETLVVQASLTRDSSSISIVAGGGIQCGEGVCCPTSPAEAVMVVEAQDVPLQPPVEPVPQPNESGAGTKRVRAAEGGGLLEGAGVKRMKPSAVGGIPMDVSDSSSAAPTVHDPMVVEEPPRRRLWNRYDAACAVVEELRALWNTHQGCRWSVDWEHILTILKECGEGSCEPIRTALVVLWVLFCPTKDDVRMSSLPAQGSKCPSWLSGRLFEAAVRTMVQASGTSRKLVVGKIDGRQEHADNWLPGALGLGRHESAAPGSSTAGTVPPQPTGEDYVATADRTVRQHQECYRATRTLENTRLLCLWLAKSLHICEVWDQYETGTTGGDAPSVLCLGQVVDVPGFNGAALVDKYLPKVLSKLSDLPADELVPEGFCDVLHVYGAQVILTLFGSVVRGVAAAGAPMTRLVLNKNVLDRTRKPDTRTPPCWCGDGLLECVKNSACGRTFAGPHPALAYRLSTNMELGNSAMARTAYAFLRTCCMDQDQERAAWSALVKLAGAEPGFPFFKTRAWRDSDDPLRLVEAAMRSESWFTAWRNSKTDQSPKRGRRGKRLSYKPLAEVQAAIGAGNHLFPGMSLGADVRVLPSRNTAQRSNQTVRHQLRFTVANVCLGAPGGHIEWGASEEPMGVVSKWLERPSFPVLASEEVQRQKAAFFSVIVDRLRVQWKYGALLKNGVPDPTDKTKDARPASLAVLEAYVRAEVGSEKHVEALWIMCSTVKNGSVAMPRDGSKEMTSQYFRECLVIVSFTVTAPVAVPGTEHPLEKRAVSDTVQVWGADVHRLLLVGIRDARSFGTESAIEVHEHLRTNDAVGVNSHGDVFVFQRKNDIFAVRNFIASMCPGLGSKPVHNLPVRLRFPNSLDALSIRLAHKTVVGPLLPVSNVRNHLTGQSYPSRNQVDNKRLEVVRKLFAESFVMLPNSAVLVPPRSGPRGSPHDNIKALFLVQNEALACTEAVAPVAAWLSRYHAFEAEVNPRFRSLGGLKNMLPDSDESLSTTLVLQGSHNGPDGFQVEIAPLRAEDTTTLYLHLQLAEGQDGARLQRVQGAPRRLAILSRSSNGAVVFRVSGTFKPDRIRKSPGSGRRQRPTSISSSFSSSSSLSTTTPLVSSSASVAGSSSSSSSASSSSSSSSSVRERHQRTSTRALVAVKRVRARVRAQEETSVEDLEKLLRDTAVRDSEEIRLRKLPSRSFTFFSYFVFADCFAWGFAAESGLTHETVSAKTVIPRDEICRERMRLVQEFAWNCAQGAAFSSKRSGTAANVPPAATLAALQTVKAVFEADVNFMERITAQPLTVNLISFVNEVLRRAVSPTRKSGDPNRVLPSSYTESQWLVCLDLWVSMKERWPQAVSSTEKDSGDKTVTQSENRRLATIVAEYADGKETGATYQKLLAHAKAAEIEKSKAKSKTAKRTATSSSSLGGGSVFRRHRVAGDLRKKTDLATLSADELCLITNDLIERDGRREISGPVKKISSGAIYGALEGPVFLRFWSGTQADLQPRTQVEEYPTTVAVREAETRAQQIAGGMAFSAHALSSLLSALRCWLMRFLLKKGPVESAGEMSVDSLVRFTQCLPPVVARERRADSTVTELLVDRAVSLENLGVRVEAVQSVLLELAPAPDSVSTAQIDECGYDADTFPLIVQDLLLASLAEDPDSSQRRSVPASTLRATKRVNIVSFGVAVAVSLLSQDLFDADLDHEDGPLLLSGNVEDFVGELCVKRLSRMSVHNQKLHRACLKERLGAWVIDAELLPDSESVGVAEALTLSAVPFYVVQAESKLVVIFPLMSYSSSTSTAKSSQVKPKARDTPVERPRTGSLAKGMPFWGDVTAVSLLGERNCASTVAHFLHLWLTWWSSKRQSGADEPLFLKRVLQTLRDDSCLSIASLGRRLGDILKEAKVQQHCDYRDIYGNPVMLKETCSFEEHWDTVSAEDSEDEAWEKEADESENESETGFEILAPRTNSTSPDLELDVCTATMGGGPKKRTRSEMTDSAVETDSAVGADAVATEAADGVGDANGVGAGVTKPADVYIDFTLRPQEDPPLGDDYDVAHLFACLCVRGRENAETDDPDAPIPVAHANARMKFDMRSSIALHGNSTLSEEANVELEVALTVDMRTALAACVFSRKGAPAPATCTYSAPRVRFSRAAPEDVVKRASEAVFAVLLFWALTSTARDQVHAASSITPDDDEPANTRADGESADEPAANTSADEWDEEAVMSAENEVVDKLTEALGTALYPFHAGLFVDMKDADEKKTPSSNLLWKRENAMRFISSHNQAVFSPDAKTGSPWITIMCAKASPVGETRYGSWSRHFFVSWTPNYHSLCVVCISAPVRRQRQSITP